VVTAVAVQSLLRSFAIRSSVKGRLIVNSVAGLSRIFVYDQNKMLKVEEFFFYLFVVESGTFYIFFL